MAEVRGRGLLQAIEIVGDRETLSPYPEADNIANRVVAAAMDEGVFFYAGGTGEFRDMVCMGPPFIIDEAQIDELVGALVEAVNRVCR